MRTKQSCIQIQCNIQRTQKYKTRGTNTGEQQYWTTQRAMNRPDNKAIKTQVNMISLISEGKGLWES